jgi:hypothetical protein
MNKSLAARLGRLESAKHWRSPGCEAKVERLLGSLRHSKFRDAGSLIRFHDALLFLRAFPQSPGVVQKTDRLLEGMPREVARLRKSIGDMSPFDAEAVSGIAGTTLSDTFTYEVARWLVDRYSQQVAAVWDMDEQARRLGAALPRFVPFLDDDSLVEADTPYLTWLSNASGAGCELEWLLKRIHETPVPIEQKTQLYDGLEIQLDWELQDSSASRTLARRAMREFFFHKEPLIRRNQVSLDEEFRSPPLPVRKLSRQGGEGILDMCREAVTVRYRELYGTTRGDPDQVYEADPGRGVQIFLWGVPPDRRLPLRAYHAGFTLKNGVPVNYIEGISLFEWMEVGFNAFYAYRDGETAWIYSKALHFLHQLTGVACISVYPYQLGHDNEEAIQSGAFWFYRKFGFRPGRIDLLAIAQREERRMARNPKHRTSERTLRKLAAGHAFYEIGEQPRGLWDTFSTRNLGFAVQRCMAENYGGSPERMRNAARTGLARLLEVETATWSSAERNAFENYAVLLSLVPGLAQWAPAQKQALTEIIRAKAAPHEGSYLRLLQQHAGLRQAIVRLGSAPPATGAQGR